MAWPEASGKDPLHLYRSHIMQVTSANDARTSLFTVSGKPAS